MKVLYLALLVVISSNSYGLSEAEKIAKLEYYKFKFPLLVCASKEYRNCYGDISIEECVTQMKKYRKDCNVPVTNSDYESPNQNYGQYSQCMFFKHGKIKNIEEAKNHCIGQFSIDMDKNNQFIKNSDPEWVKSVLD